VTPVYRCHKPVVTQQRGCIYYAYTTAICNMRRVLYTSTFKKLTFATPGVLITGLSLHVRLYSRTAVILQPISIDRSGLSAGPRSRHA
jgi:hypothetical protein